MIDSAVDALSTGPLPYPQISGWGCAGGSDRSTMRHMTPMQLIRTIAADQHGVVTAEQCRADGIGKDTVQRLCRSREWLRLSRAVYLVGAEDAPEPPRAAVIRAAVLSAGPEAIAVLDTAAEIHGIAGILRPRTV